VAAPALPADVAKLREQLIRDQAPSSRARTEIFRPGRFVQRYGRPYSSRRLPISTLEEMRTDALLRFAQLISLVPIFTGKWKIACTNARKAQFIDHALRQIIGRLYLQCFESWNFGFQALVKEFGLTVPDWQFLDKDAAGGPKMAPVWDGGPEVPALIWLPFVPLSPRSVAPVWTAGGDFNGIALAQNGVGYGLPMVPFAQDDLLDVLPELMASFSNPDDPQRKKIDVDHALWITNERDANWGSIWGRSRLGPAFKFWWSYEMTLGILNRSVERKGDPTIVVSYPQGRSMVNGQEVDNQTIAMQIGESARSGAVLSVPSEVWGEDMATANQASKWKIDYLKAEERFDELRAVLDYLDTAKIRSMMISELSAFEGSGGTSSRNVAAVTGERSYEAQIFTQVEWDEVINAYMIPQLANQNFPELSDVPARKVTQSFGEGESALAADLLRSIANANAGDLPVDLPALLDRFQIDALTGTDLEKWAKRMATQAEVATQPPPTPAQPGGDAGVTDTGFYYSAPEQIVLEDDILLASLPKSKHYSDSAVLAQTRLVRRLYKALLAAQYEDFAVHVARSDLSLAEDDPADSAAARIVSSWRYTGALLAKTVKAVALALSKILARAGALELSASRIKTDAWKPDDADLQAWARENAGALVRDVDTTTRKQLQTFLAAELRAGRGAEEIATNLRKHFAEFPDWRADLIAREETKHYYNAGTLFAAQAAGSDQVQALDAQDGPTDEECERRNGRVFSVADAWSESAREHIRGTLGWRIIPSEVQLSFKRRSREDMGDKAARIDQQERVIYLVEGMDPATEGRFLERAVDWLVRSA
jgi:SPP1 gp7 family putative phage head morphogenesis protein